MSGTGHLGDRPTRRRHQGDRFTTGTRAGPSRDDPSGPPPSRVSPESGVHKTLTTPELAPSVYHRIATGRCPRQARSNTYRHWDSANVLLSGIS